MGLFRPRHLLEWDDNPTEVNIWYVVFCVLLVLFAGCMSGLTLGLLQLDIVDLEVLRRSGSAQEQRYAKSIVPVVKNAHYLLVTLLLCNAAAMETLPIFLDKMVHESVAIVISVTAVLLFGEIIPQAVCSKHGLMIGSIMAFPVRILMFITAPISWPLSKLLDRVLGGDHASLFRRKQLKALVHIHSKEEGFGGKLTADEIQIITGALDLTNKQAYYGMTPLDKVFMLSTSQLLDESTLQTIMAAKPFSRVPVYRGQDKKDIIGLILVKELLEHVKRFPESPVSSLKIRPIPRLCALTPMYTVLKLFRTGRAHMALLTQPLAAGGGSGAGGGALTPRGSAGRCVDAAGGAVSPLVSAATSTLTTPGRTETSALLSGSPYRHISPRLLAASLSHPLRLHASPRQPPASHPPATVTDPLPTSHHPGHRSQPPQPPGPPFVGDSVSSLAPSACSLQVQHAASAQGLMLSSAEAVCSVSVRRTWSMPAHDGESPLELKSVGSAPAAQQDKQQQRRGGGGRAPLARTEDEDDEDDDEDGGGRASMPGSAAAPGDPVGIITIEDVIEELMQLEIVDETDLFVDNEQSVPVADAELDCDLPDSLKMVMRLAEATKSLGLTVGVAGGATAGAAAGTLRARVSRGQLSVSSAGACCSEGGGADVRPPSVAGGASVAAAAAAAVAGVPLVSGSDGYGGDKAPRRAGPKPCPKGGTLAGLLAAVLQPPGAVAATRGSAVGSCPSVIADQPRRPGTSFLRFGFRGGREADGLGEELVSMPPELGGAAEGGAGAGRQGAAAAAGLHGSGRWGLISGGGGVLEVAQPCLRVNSLPPGGGSLEQIPRQVTLPVGYTFSPRVAVDESWSGGVGCERV